MMNVVSSGPLALTLLMLALGASAIAVALGYIARPGARRAYAGGQGRYALALTVQALAFTLPFPFVWVMFLGLSPEGLNFVVATAVSFGVLFVLRFAPWTGPLLRDLSRANAEAVLRRKGIGS